MGTPLLDRFGHLAIWEDNGTTVHYYYNEWKPSKPLTLDAQGKPVLSKRFDYPMKAMAELLRHGYGGRTNKEWDALSAGEYVPTSSTR